ncbi:MAG: DUF4956 domain-containing protein [Oscillospiraceae bacterium]|nr:DUF4956 domain-containing protein [Oscillospiraceae bacterium]
MREKLFELIEHQNNLTMQQIAMNISMSAVIGFLIYISYMISHRGTIYSKKFNASLLILTMLTGIVMTVIGNNIALSLGMVGALSIVRFRTAIKDSRDTVYIFWAIIVGICCGVGDFSVAFIGSVLVFAVMLVLGLIKNDNRMLLIIRGDRGSQSTAQAKVYQMFKKNAILRVQNTTENNFELIFELSQKTIKKHVSSSHQISDELYKIGKIEYVNLVMQNDEVSN